jgi:hypothetical protein
MAFLKQIYARKSQVRQQNGGRYPSITPDAFTAHNNLKINYLEAYHSFLVYFMTLAVSEASVSHHFSHGGTSK